MGTVEHMFEDGMIGAAESRVAYPEQNLVAALDAHRDVCIAQRRFLALIAEADRRDVWGDSGARDLAHWLSMRYGISQWKSCRWIGAAHALESLPRLSRSLESGELGLDKVVELALFATPEAEADLIRWAGGVSCATIRHRGDLWARRTRAEIVDPEQSRTLAWWWFDEGRRFGLEAELPAAQGAVVARAIERITGQIPVMPDEVDDRSADARRADALVALCSTGGSAGAEDRRPTIVVHAQLEGLERGSGGCELEDGPVLAQTTVRRLLCDARIQTVVEDGSGRVVGLGRASREPSAWMVRQVRYRDRECRFPACGARQFTEAHHIRWWRHGGPTDLENLVLICSFHHRLVHEYGGSMRRDPDGTVRWFRPDGTGSGRGLRRRPMWRSKNVCCPLPSAEQPDARYSCGGRTSSMARSCEASQVAGVWASAERCRPRPRRIRSSSGISSASRIASAVSERSNGLIANACRPRRPKAPAFRERIRAPPRMFTTGPSIATRFIPSCTGFTSMASYSAYAATA
jgi:hypothetical protein